METSIRNRVDNNQNKNDWYQNLTPISKENYNVNQIHSMNNTSTSYHNNTNNTLDESNEHKEHKEKIITDNEYKNDLLIAIIPLILILLVFGGKLSVLVLCFGCLFCYIFDLMGSIEGTLISLVVTMLSQIACIVWSSRVFLSESIWNFSLILLIWIIIFYSFIISCNFFHGIVNEFAMILSILNVLMFATLPMVGSAIISWFLCVEIPSLELGSCFTIVYFFYIFYLGNPRVITKVIVKNNKTNTDMIIDKQELTVLLNNELVLNSMYIQPVIMSLLISIALHWNVLSTNRMFITNILLAICEPSLLMILCYQWHKEKRNKILNKDKDNSLLASNELGFEIIRLVIAIICIFQAQNHPMFDDLKAFSSLSEPYIGYAIMVIFGLIVMAYYMRNFLIINKIKLEDVDEFYLNTLSKQQKQRNACIFIMEACVTLCFALAIAIFGWVINLSNQVIPVTVIGVIALSEYYSSTTKSVVSNILMLILSACSTWVTALNFSQNTIYYLVYELIWHFNISMSQFSLLFSILVAFSIILPSIITISNHNSITNQKHHSEDVLLGETSSSSLSSENHSMNNVIFGGSNNIKKTMAMIGNYVFEFSFPMLIIIFTSLELMFREQDWSLIQIPADMIYPSYYFTATAVIVIATAIVLYYHNGIGITSTWIVLTVELSKLLQLMNISSLGIFSFCLLVQAYTLPFIRQINQYIRIENDVLNKGGISTIDASSSLQGVQRIQIHSFEIILYMIISILATYWAKIHMIIHNILVVLLARDPTELQQISLALGIWFLYITCILQVFCFKWKFLRSFTFVLSGILFLIALDGFGHLNLISTNTSSTLKYTITTEEDISLSEHPVIFLVLSMIIPVLAWIQVIPLHNLMNCILYSLLFAFISTKTMIAWAFPITLANDSLNHNILSFPFIYLYVLKFFLILTAVWNPTINTHQRRNNRMMPTSTSSSIGMSTQDIPIITKTTFIIFCSIPFFAIIYTIAVNLSIVTIQGIVWSAMLSCTTLCITTRYIELFQNANGNVHYTSISQQFICIPTSLLVIIWMIIAVSMNHKLDYVTLIPLSTLLLLSIKPGSLYHNTTSSEIISKIWAIFWISISIYSIFIKGFNKTDSIQNEFDTIHGGLFGLDSDISIWTNAIYIPLSNLIQLLLLILALYKGFYPNTTNDHEEMIFVISVFSLLPILSSQINSIRFLGILSMLWNGWRFYEIGRKTQYSNQLI